MTAAEHLKGGGEAGQQVPGSAPETARLVLQASQAATGGGGRGWGGLGCACHLPGGPLGHLTSSVCLGEEVSPSISGR